MGKEELMSESPVPYLSLSLRPPLLLSWYVLMGIYYINVSFNQIILGG